MSSDSARTFLNTYRNGFILESFRERTQNNLLVLLLNDVWGCSEDAESGLPLAGVGRLACLEQCSEKFRPVLVYKTLSEKCKVHALLGIHTLLRILACNLRDRISNLVSHAVNTLSFEAFQQLGPDCEFLRILQAHKKFTIGFSVWILPRFGGYASKKYRCESP